MGQNKRFCSGVSKSGLFQTGGPLTNHRSKQAFQRKFLFQGSLLESGQLEPIFIIFFNATLAFHDDTRWFLQLCLEKWPLSNWRTPHEYQEETSLSAVNFSFKGLNTKVVSLSLF